MFSWTLLLFSCDRSCGCCHILQFMEFDVVVAKHSQLELVFETWVIGARDDCIEFFWVADPIRKWLHRFERIQQRL